MVVFIRSNDIVSDPRAMKYINFMAREGVPCRRIAWDRYEKASEEANTVYYHKKAGFNVGGVKAAFNKARWMIFVVKSLKKMNLSDDVLHGCDLDSAFPAVVYRMLYNRDVKIVFDVFDWYTATLHDQNILFRLVFRIMERITVQQSDYIIICEPERIKQIPYRLKKAKLSVLPNIPYFDSDFIMEEDSEYKFDNDLITLSYVGGFAPERCLEEIIDIAEEGLVNLNIAGYGLPCIEERIRNLKGRPNIKYYGKVKYEEGLSIMYNSDVIYAMYATTNPNHVFAAPNKFYEAMMLGKPLFTTKGTIVERKVMEMGIGYVAGESKEEIVNVIKQLSKNDMLLKGEESHRIWESKYKTYTDEYMKNVYSQIIKRQSI